VAALLIALALGFLALFGIRLFTGVVIYAVLAICVLSFLGLGAFMTYYGYSQVQAMTLKSLSTTVPQVIMWCGVACIVIGFVIALAVGIFLMRIRRAIGVIQESSKALMYMPQVVFVPVIFAIIIGFFAAYWAVVSIFLYSSGEPTINGAAVRFVMTSWTRGIFAYHVS